MIVFFGYSYGDTGNENPTTTRDSDPAVLMLTHTCPGAILHAVCAPHGV